VKTPTFKQFKMMCVRPPRSPLTHHLEIAVEQHALRPQDVVFKPDRTSLLVETLLSQLKHGPPSRRRKQRNSASKKNRHDRDFDAINKTGGKQTPKEFTAAEKSNILARQASEFAARRAASGLMVMCG
jgi:hypothetical protein